MTITILTRACETLDHDDAAFIATLSILCLVASVTGRLLDWRRAR